MRLPTNTENNQVSVNIYTSSNVLPDGLSEENFFHSPQLFRLAKDTPRHKPYMVTVEDDNGRILAQMLALVRYHSSWFPPYLYRHCRITGEGYYADESQKSELFDLMLRQLTEKIGRWTLYLEVSNLSSKMFAYKQLRENNFFPVRWISIHNSLHSHTPEERIGERMQQQIQRAYQRGVVTDEVRNEDDLKAFIRLLRKHNRLKPKRYIPADEFFAGLYNSDNARLFLTRFREHVIGCSAVVYSQRQAYLWYAAYRRKSFVFLHPDVLTIWHVLKDAHSRGFEHVYFMDVGLPYRKNVLRDFILSFGGKQTSDYRWFHCSIKWINSLLSWFYR